MFKSGKGIFRYGRGSQKFGQSWDRQKMEERARARERARAKQQAHDSKQEGK